MTDTRAPGTRSGGAPKPAPEAVWPADPGRVFVAGAGGHEEPPALTDGRRLRRALNREAVVDALLDLYTEGNLRPSTDEIAERAGISPRSLFRYFEDADDLAGEAVARQLARVLPILPIETGPDAPLADRVAALADQRLRLFTTSARPPTSRACGHPSSPGWPSRSPRPGVSCVARCGRCSPPSSRR